MLEMRLETLLSGLVRQELISKGGNPLALHFHFDCALSYFHNDSSKEYYVRRGLHLLCYQKVSTPYSVCFFILAFDRGGYPTLEMQR